MTEASVSSLRDPTTTSPPQAAARTAQPQPSAEAAIKISITQIVNAVVTAVLVAIVMGSLAFYQQTTREIYALQDDLTRIELKVGDIYKIVDRAHPRNGVAPPSDPPMPPEPPRSP